MVCDALVDRGYLSRYETALGLRATAGVEGGAKRAVERTAPMAMLLYSLIVLWFAKVGYRSYRAPNRPWYREKNRASFADMLRTLRCESIRERFSSMAVRGRGRNKVLKTLLFIVQQAA